jgi:hypothetical protein
MKWVNGHKNIKKIKGTWNYDITKYSDNNDNIFNLKLIDKSNNRLSYNETIGYVRKNCRILNLKETHDLVCNKEHDITHCHDPVTDVIYTKCIFNYKISKIKPKKLIKLCRYSIRINNESKFMYYR